VITCSARWMSASSNAVVDARTATIGARLLSTVGYALALGGAGLIVVLAKVVACGPEGHCGGVGDVAIIATDRLWFVLMYAIVWLGPAGRLPGAR